MAKTTLDHMQVAQLAYVVTDLEAGIRQFNEAMGIGPWYRPGSHPLSNVTYRGQAAAPVVVDIALAWSGELNIELIEQQSEVPSSYREMFAPGEGGLHHVAVWATDYAAEVAALDAAGFPISMEMNPWGDVRISYVDTRGLLGHMVEVYTDHPSLRKVHAHVRARAQDWDGKTDLTRPLDFSQFLES